MWRVFRTAEGFQKIAAVRQERMPERRSIVVAGSSVLRGSLQSLIDALVPNAWQSFAGVPSIPGEGTTVKCWGWLEYQVDNLHLGFLDWRLPSYGRSDKVSAAARIRKTMLEEKPDIFVIELGWNFKDHMRQLDSELALFWGPLFKAVLPSFHGKVVLCLGPVSPFNARICEAECGISRARARSARSSLAKLLASWPSDVRNASRGKIVMLDPAFMALPMFFDGETDMVRKTSSQHWHRYDRKQSPGRKVFGVVAETLGQIFLSELLRVTELRSGAPGKEVTHTRACAQCPVRSCCPWRPIPLHLEHTLRNVRDLTNFTSWSNLTMESCGQMEVNMAVGDVVCEVQASIGTHAPLHSSA
ncbi:hypothetical protein AK812_SmicGene16887 [Symbiodinium microadriaticum]|uniref:Uncharacterized protein n=1 Tax=Symbiodinium microadriaticum TaxID=2951 RepID=A0A1Q9DZ42_SYMMI|nr:hypothetical protein AK812_SmicGene16887 [Symbiodinium microadriaticum]